MSGLRACASIASSLPSEATIVRKRRPDPVQIGRIDRREPRTDDQNLTHLRTHGALTGPIQQHSVERFVLRHDRRSGECLLGAGAALAPINRGNLGHRSATLFRVADEKSLDAIANDLWNG